MNKGGKRIMKNTSGKVGLTGILFGLFTTVLGLIISGMVIKYGWNTFIATPLQLPMISTPVAIGMDLLGEYIFGHSTPVKLQSLYEELSEKSVFLFNTTHLLVNILLSGYTLVVMAVISLFI